MRKKNWHLMVVFGLSNVTVNPNYAGGYANDEIDVITAGAGGNGTANNEKNR